MTKLTLKADSRDFQSQNLDLKADSLDSLDSQDDHLNIWNKDSKKLGNHAFLNAPMLADLALIWHRSLNNWAPYSLALTLAASASIN